MFGISLTELVLVLVIVLLVFGPDKLPEMAQKLGRLSAMLKKNTDSLRREFYNSAYPPAGDFNNRITQPVQDLKEITQEIKDDFRRDSTEIEKKESENTND